MGAMNQKTVLIDNLVTTTWYNIRRQLVDNIHQITPFFDMLNSTGKLKAKVPEGTHWEVPIRYEKDDQNVGYFTRGSLAGTAEKETMTNYMFYRRNVWNAIVRYFDDDQKNRGAAKILDYANEKVDGAKEALRQLFEADCINQSTDANSIDALETLVATDPTAGTLGGITRSGNSFTQNQYKDCTGLTTGTSMVDEMERMYNLCSVYKSGMKRSPNFIWTSRKLYQDYKRIARAMGIIDITSSKQRVDLGFGDLSFNGAEMYWSPQIDDDKLWMLNTENISFVYDPAAWFEMTDWKPLQGNSLDRTAQIVCVCNLTIDCTPKHGVMFNWTPTTN
jgi:hypothetical protein